MILLPRFTLILSCLAVTLSYSQIGIGTSYPDASSILEVSSTTKGFLPPRLSTLDRQNISQPAEGLIVYNTSQNCLQFYNGDAWFDLCCSQKVDNNLLAITYLYRLDPSKVNTLSKMDLDQNNTGSNSGTIPNEGDYVYAVDMIDDSETVTATLNYIAGSIEPSNNPTGDGIFVYETESSSVNYKQKNYLTRTTQFANGTTASGSRLEADIPDLQQEMEIFIVGKFDGNPPGSSASFFSSADGSETQGSFQLGSGATVAPTSECSPEYFTLRLKDGTNKYRLCGAAIQSPDGSDKRVSAISDELHVFNIRMYLKNGNYTIDLFIDGELVTRIDTLTEFPKLEKLKLFTNRTTRNSTFSSIGELLISDKLFSDGEQKTINNYLLCKYSE
mgnify:CR=1 FL=1